MLPVDSLLLSSRAPIGLLAINKIPVCTNQGFKSLIPSKEVDVGYLYYVLKANVSSLQARGNGATFKELAKPAVENFEIPLPPINDQIRIAHLLGKVDRLIAQRKQRVQDLDNLLKSLFLKMFGDPKLNPRGFPVRRLSDFYISPNDGTKCGPFGSALKKNELVESGVPVWNMDNIGQNGQMVMPFRMWITTDKYNDLSAYSVQDGDIIISRAGTVGKMCVARLHNQPAIISTNLIRVRLGSELRPLHFVSLMLYCKGRVGRLKTGADGSFTHMNTGVLDSLEFPYPPVELQDRFGDIASKVDSVKTLYQRSLSELETLYSALSQQAFSAKLDLSHVPLPETKPLEENTIVTNQLQTQDEKDITIDLPDTDNMLDGFESAAAREALITYWIENYRAQLGDTPLSVQHFMSAVQTRLAELQPDNDFELSVSDYEHIKNWVFEAVTAGTLSQEFDDAGNRIHLKAVKT